MSCKCLQVFAFVLTWILGFKLVCKSLHDPIMCVFCKGLDCLVDLFVLGTWNHQLGPYLQSFSSLVVLFMFIVHVCCLLFFTELFHSH